MENEGSGAGGCSAGSIVWVRRRNGSWWPGKILGPEELDTSHLTSPRSGTPVKLLGREDASVDWYNLEKSKRVKAFRCGEFDDCIEKAESSQGMPIKKREKYARREDAILHALELEKQMLEKQGKLGIESDRMNSKSSGGMKKGFVASSENFGDDNGKLENSNSHQFPSGLETYHKDKTIFGSISARKAKDGNQLSGDDDHSETMPRMRGLQDFGLRIAPPKRRLSPSAASNGSRKPTTDNHADALPSGGDLSMGNASHANGVEQMGAAFRAKRSRCVYLETERSGSLDYLDYNETSPNQNEMSASQFGVGNYHTHPGSLIEEHSSGFTEDVETDSSETDSSESESDSSATEPDMDEEMAMLSEAEWNTRGSISTEEHDESAFSGDMSHLYHHDHVSANEAVSKWKLKGKRNTRNLTKRSADTSDGKGSIHGTYPEERGSGLSQRTLRQHLSLRRDEDFDYSVDEDDIIEKDFGTQRIKVDGRDSLVSRAASRGRHSVDHNIFDWDYTWEDQPAFKGYWGMKGERFDAYFDDNRQFGGRSRSMLVNVDLKVQGGYQKAPVPIVSLMSKLNGKAIIGHPIQIEALEDGSAETLLSTVDDFDNEVFNNENTALQPAWRTARRTANVRVPRPHLSSALDGDEAPNDVPFLDQERKVPFKKLNAGSSSHKSILERSSLPHIPRPPTEKKVLKKQPKKGSLSASQKTRTLSSIATEQNVSIKPINDSNSYQVDRLIKAESSGPTTVACIPVKLVFSRLLEKINRPPSKAASNAVLLNSDVVRNQS
ncbi:uncharacterized protein LOC126700104 isoform X2 [Quercus robur]|uniref:uncharacterized protein LOC126700104 isoform X2 n=1 Tax=Quercus robur TaxID=38942 RepID=UPI002161F6A9|nr:uncharacterized protein LOC126700104 isoform X2 [Quercus robur]